MKSMVSKQEIIKWIMYKYIWVSTPTIFYDVPILFDHFNSLMLHLFSLPRNLKIKIGALYYHKDESKFLS